MAVNSSSSNDSAHHLHLPFTMYCFMTRPSSLIFFAFNITKILLVFPFCILVLYIGLQRWRQHRFSSAATTSHSDTFTYHMVAMELIGVCGYTLCCWGIYRDQDDVFIVGFFLWNINWYGEMFFHMLTCVERYLAVVHPVTYLSLRGERGIRIRNISMGCVWLISFGATSLNCLDFVSIIQDVSLLIFSFFVISFCSLSVLCVLIRPGPGEQGGDRERVDQSKQRAFNTIMAIQVELLLRCCGNLALVFIIMLRRDHGCVLVMSLFWINLPSSLVLPLLFLHRAGTLACCKNNT